MKKSTIAIIVVLLLAACGLGGWKYHENQIAKMQEAGVQALRASVNLEDYREDEQNKLSAILDESEKVIRESREQAAIDAEIEKAKESYKDFKTDAELTAEEEAARQAELERQRKEEEERQAAAAAAAAAAKKSGSGKKSSKKGCVGGGKNVFN